MNGTILDIIGELRIDEELYYVWQSNIAMAFKDSYYHYKQENDKQYINNKDMYLIANDAAKNFLNLLIRK